MDTSGIVGTVIFDRDDHSFCGRVTFVECDDGNISIFLGGKEEDKTYGRLELLSEYAEWIYNKDFTSEYGKAIGKFFREYFTEAEWILAALTVL